MEKKVGLKIAQNYCLCFFDWSRTIFIKIGEEGVLNTMKNQEKVRPITNNCLVFAITKKEDSLESFGKGAL